MITPCCNAFKNTICDNCVHAPPLKTTLYNNCALAPNQPLKEAALKAQPPVNELIKVQRLIFVVFVIVIIPIIVIIIVV